MRNSKMFEQDFGWLIELQGSDGAISNDDRALGIKDGHWRWVPFDEALRFARKEDAEAVASVEVSDQPTVATEHSWE